MSSDRRPLRIASVAYWDAFATDGVSRKLAGQVAAWRTLGAEARLFVLSPRGRGVAAPVLDDVTYTFARPVERLTATRKLSGAVRRFAPDVVYLRYDLFVPPLTSSSFGKPPLVVELNTLDRVELQGRSTRARVYNRFNRSRTLGSADGVVGVTNELVRNSVEGRPDLRSLVVPNGVDPRSIPALPAPSNAQPRLCFLGSPGMRWHGVDKIVDLARLRPSWQIDIIGFSRTDLGVDPPGNLTAHGYLGRDDYFDILASADAAIGTLALHRKGMSEACPLKIPEYLLAGIPTIIGYADTNFLDTDPWYLLRLPNTEDNVITGVHRIDAWLASVRGRRVPRAEVEQRVSMSAKEGRRLAFLEEVARTARTTAGRGRR